MASPDVVTIGDDNFDAEVMKSDLPVLLDFWAVWCMPCKALLPSVEEIAKEYKGKLKVGKVDVDNNHGVAERYGIRNLPTLLIVKKGAPVDQLVGPVPKSKIVDSVKKALGA